MEIFLKFLIVYGFACFILVTVVVWRAAINFFRVYPSGISNAQEWTLNRILRKRQLQLSSHCIAKSAELKNLLQQIDGREKELSTILSTHAFAAEIDERCTAFLTRPELFSYIEAFTANKLPFGVRYSEHNYFLYTSEDDYAFISAQINEIGGQKEI